MADGRAGIQREAARQIASAGVAQHAFQRVARHVRPHPPGAIDLARFGTAQAFRQTPPEQGATGFVDHAQIARRAAGEIHRQRHIDQRFDAVAGVAAAVDPGDPVARVPEAGFGGGHDQSCSIGNTMLVTGGPWVTGSTGSRRSVLTRYGLDKR